MIPGTRSCGHSPQPHHKSRDRDECEKCAGGFFVTRRDAPKMLDLVDEALDEMAFLVEFLVVRRNVISEGPGRDHRLGAKGEKGSEPLGIIGLVGDDMIGRETVDQRLGLCAVMGLARREDEL